MNKIEIPPFEAGDPESVVSAFILAMNIWETYANRVAREKKDDAWPEIHQSQKSVFDALCTQKDRKHGRNGSFQRPPEYNPESESIVAVEKVSKTKTLVTTEREATLDSGRYRYVLVQKQNRWFIDSVKYFDGRDWQKSIL